MRLVKERLLEIEGEFSRILAVCIKFAFYYCRRTNVIISVFNTFGKSVSNERRELENLLESIIILSPGVEK